MTGKFMRSERAQMICTVRAVVVALALASFTTVAASSQSIPRIGTVHLQTALLKTKEGQAAATELQRKFAGKEQGLKKLQSEIAALREELNRSNSVASQKTKDTLARDIEQKTKVFNRELEDLQTELDQEQSRVLNDLGARMLTIVQKFASSSGYGLVIDVSSPQNPVLFASETFDITGEVVRMFNESTATAPPPTGATPTKK